MSDYIPGCDIVTNFSSFLIESTSEKEAESRSKRSRRGKSKDYKSGKRNENSEVLLRFLVVMVMRQGLPSFGRRI